MAKIIKKNDVKTVQVKIVQKRSQTIVTNSLGNKWIFEKSYDAELALGVLVACTLGNLFRDLGSTRDTFKISLTIS